MYTIELTRGIAWDAPVIEAHSVRPLHIVDVERKAQALLLSARQTSKRMSPTNYRILDHLGNCVRSSLATKRSKQKRWRRAGRTY